jgi:hypothetical protein
MDDKQILRQISELVDEEHGLRRRAQAGEIDSEEERARLKDLEVALDRCWDLLRRRRAAREYGADPGGAQTRSAEEVERYLQ